MEELLAAAVADEGVAGTLLPLPPPESTPASGSARSGLGGMQKPLCASLRASPRSTTSLKRRRTATEELEVEIEEEVEGSLPGSDASAPASLEPAKVETTL